MKKAYMIVDLQFGSTGKGLLAGYLAKREEPDTVVTAWGPNSGHTYIDNDDRSFVHTMLANGVVSPNLNTILIGPGSVINLDSLYDEICQCIDLLCGKQIIIHPMAIIVDENHRALEKRNISIGSTMKGTGAAMIQRILRDPDNMNTAECSINKEYMDSIWDIGVSIYVDSVLYNYAMLSADIIQIEGAQGYSLSIYHGMYPYVTSRDVTPAQIMADCAVPYGIHPEVYGTLRALPIRVANRYDDEGKEIGSSGPCYADQVELSWEKLEIKPELTTVTQLPRRIFSFSREQLNTALYQCGPSKLFLNFANYLNDDKLERCIKTVENSIDKFSSINKGCKLSWLGFGPRDSNIHDRGSN